MRSLVGSLSQDPIVRVCEFSGDFQLDARSHLFERIVIEKQYEPRLVQRVKSYLQRDRDVVDVGANVGFFTVMCAKEIDTDRRVLSIEPTRNALRRLYKNITLNEVEHKVVVFEGVASDSEAVLEIKTIKGKEEYSSLGVLDHPEIASEDYDSEWVHALPIDSLVKTHDLDPGFMKVDVEGMEHVVFAGAHNVLKSHRPLILSELSDPLLRKNGSSAEEVIRFIRSFDYCVIDPIDPLIPAGSKQFGDIFCIPREFDHALIAAGTGA